MQIHRCIFIYMAVELFSRQTFKLAICKTDFSAYVNGQAHVQLYFFLIISIQTDQKTHLKNT